MLLTTPPHLKYVATLPCNLLLMACFADINVSQSSVATHAKCGGIFDIHVTANLPKNRPVKTFLKSVKNWQNYGHDSVAPFLTHPVYVSLLFVFSFKQINNDDDEPFLYAKQSGNWVLKLIFGIHLESYSGFDFSFSLKLYKKLSYRRVTARCVLSVEILPIATQQCRNYLYDKSWPNWLYEVGGLVGGNVSWTIALKHDATESAPIVSGVINKPTTVELCISPVYRRLAVAKFCKSTM